MTDNDSAGQQQGPRKRNGDMPEPKETGKAETAGQSSADSGEEALRSEIAELKDRLLRTMAEMENLRRRTEREKSDAGRYAISAFAKDLISVGDNLSRALHSLSDKDRAGADDNVRNMIAGIEMTERELLNVFGRHGIERVDPSGDRFDPNFHQAMFEIEDPSVEAGTVLEVMQPGYLIGERVLRPAMVGVARGGTKAKPPATEESAAAGAGGSASTAAGNGDKPAKPVKGRKPESGVGGKIDRNA